LHKEIEKQATGEVAMSFQVKPRGAALKRLLLVTIMAFPLANCTRPYNQPKLEEPRPGDAAAAPTASYPGIQNLMTSKPLQVFWTHGMCTHDKSWATSRAALVANAMGTKVPILSEQVVPAPKRQPNDEDAFTLKTRIEAPQGNADVTFFIWSPMTQRYKTQISFDNSSDDTPSGENVYTRAKLNGALKKGLMNDCLVDAVVYSGANGDRIRHAMQNALCEALGGRFSPTQTCDLSNVNDDRPLVFVTESLGSKFLFDAIRDLWNEQSAAGKQAFAQRLQSLRMLFMAANQIPLLDPANPVLPPAGVSAAPGASPSATNSLSTTVDIIRNAKRVPRQSPPTPPGSTPQTPMAIPGATIEPWAIVAFTDPNDLLSYRLLPRIIGRNEAREREPDEPRLINVIVSNDDTLLGYVERPDNAHCGYRWNPYVIGLIVKGYELGKPLPAVDMSAASSECF
jgi:hypothetical protein